MGGLQTIFLGYLGIATAVSSIANAAVYVPVIPVPGAQAGSTGVLGINDNNIIAGSYYTSDGVQHGFFGTLEGNYTTFDVGVTFTQVRGIGNDGSITGQADDKDGNDYPFERLPNGTVKAITFQGQTFAYGLAQGFNAKDFVGYGTGQDFPWETFYARKGKYAGDIETGIQYSSTKAINDSWLIAGDYYSQADQKGHGFVLQNTTGTLSIVDYPDESATYTFLDGLNNEDIAAGEWMDADYNTHGFMVDIDKATFTPLKPPHAKFSQAWGVNKIGLIAVTSDQGSFIYCPKKKKCPMSGAEVTDAKPIHITSFPLVTKGKIASRPPVESSSATGRRPRPLWWRQP